MKKAIDYFYDISAIPRESGNESGIADYVESFAKENNLDYIRDKVNNIIIYKNASAGKENDDTVMIQGHMDMVCEKSEGVIHDFKKDPLDLVLEGDILKANGTTLGADDGVAVALMLELLADKNLVNPPLECVFTVNEEKSMLGAISIDLSNCKSKYLINADSEQDGVFTCGCCGGAGVNFSIPVNRVSKKGKFYKVSVNGLKGGHSGAEINKGRLNAILLTSALFNSNDYIVSIDRDGKNNVIPSWCDIITMTSKDEIINRYNMIKDSWKVVENDIDISIEELEIDELNVLDSDSCFRVLEFLHNLPFGVQKMCDEPEGLVHTSLNIGNIVSKSDEICGGISVRSIEIQTKEDLINKVNQIIENSMGTSKVLGSYPGWEYKKESHLRDIMSKVYKAKFGISPKIEVIHAGLECGLILEKMPNLDIVSIGCEIYDIHSPNERMSISSFARMVEFVKSVLIEL